MRRPFAVLAKRLSAALFWRRRREAAEAVATLAWRARPGHTPRERVLRLLDPLELRGGRAGAPRPAGQTRRAWLGSWAGDLRANADRTNLAVHPLVRPLGLTGRGLVRVVMGLSCNVPAVISTRARSACSRRQAISAIPFGAACSHQFPATMAVFAACGRPWLTAPFLLCLGASAAVHLGLAAPPAAVSPLNVLTLEGRTFLVWPAWSALWREARSTIQKFFALAMPVLLAIGALASLLAWGGWLDRASAFLGVFRLLPEADSAIVAPMSAGQILTAVHLAGVLTPCLVTARTIVR